jgi:hypothetical protein
MPAKAIIPPALREDLKRFQEQLDRLGYREVAERFRQAGEVARFAEFQKLAELFRKQAAPAPAPPPKKGRGPYRKPQRDRIDAALKKSFPPDGKPSATLANHEIVTPVAKAIGDRTGRFTTTILRRAGRIKDKK